MSPQPSLRRVPAALRSVVRFARPETDPVERRLRRAASVADLRAIARRRLPGGVYDSIDGGAEDERTLAANAAAFARTTFRPRVLRAVGSVRFANAAGRDVDDGASPVNLSDCIGTQFDPGSPGPTSTGSARSGTGPSSSRASRPSPTRCWRPTPAGGGEGLPGRSVALTAHPRALAATEPIRSPADAVLSRWPPIEER
nr:alpha-hydroxy-acid oxidizing protein [Iamia sp. SCSIO 61187]